MDNSIVQDLQRDIYSETFRNFMSLFESTLLETREKMDSADETEVKKLQGAVRVLKELLKLRNPSTKISTHDGGYE